MSDDTPTAIHLGDVNEGGGYADGERVFFKGTTTAGDAVLITVPTDLMGLFLQQLQAFTALAHRDRGERATSSEGVTRLAPMAVRGLQVHSSLDGSMVLIRVDMGQGIYVDVPLPIENIDQIMASLQAHAAKAREILKTTGH